MCETQGHEDNSNSARVILTAARLVGSAEAGVWWLKRAELVEDLVRQPETGGGDVFLEVLGR